MRKSFRILTLAVVLLGIIGIVGVFAGGAKETGAAAGEKVTLKVATHTGHAATLPPANNDLLVYKEYEKLTNIHIEWDNIQAANYVEVMRARLAAGLNLPDIVNMNGLGDIAQYGRDGLIIAQNDLIAKYAPNLNKWFAQPENQIYKILNTSPDGNIYGVQSYVEAQFLSMGYLWNKPWLDTLGIKSFPDKIDDLVATLKLFRDKDPNGNGKKDEIPLSPAAGAGYLNILSNMFGFEYSIVSEFQVDGAGKVYWAYTAPRQKDFLTFMAMLYKEGLLDKAYSTDSWTQTAEKVTNDTVGLITCWATFTTTYSGLAPKGKKDGSVPVFVNGPPIEGPTGDKYFVRREIMGGDPMAITKASKKPEAAIRWLDFIRNSPEALNLQNNGIEGVTYKMVDGKVVGLSRGDKGFPDLLLEVGGSQPPFSHIQRWEGDLRWMPWAVANDKSYAKMYKKPSFPLIQATKEEQDTLNKLMTDINTLRAEMVGKMISGAEPPSKFDDYVAQFKKLGIDEVIKVRQQQYERFQKLTK